MLKKIFPHDFIKITHIFTDIYGIKSAIGIGEHIFGIWELDSLQFDLDF